MLNQTPIGASMSNQHTSRQYYTYAGFGNSNINKNIMLPKLQLNGLQFLQNPAVQMAINSNKMFTHPNFVNEDCPKLLHQPPITEQTTANMMMQMEASGRKWCGELLQMCTEFIGKKTDEDKNAARVDAAVLHKNNPVVDIESSWPVDESMNKHKIKTKKAREKIKKTTKHSPSGNHNCRQGNSKENKQIIKMDLQDFLEHSNFASIDSDGEDDIAPDNETCCLSISSPRDMKNQQPLCSIIAWPDNKSKNTKMATSTTSPIQIEQGQSPMHNQQTNTSAFFVFSVSPPPRNIIDGLGRAANNKGHMRMLTRLRRMPSECESEDSFIIFGCDNNNSDVDSTDDESSSADSDFENVDETELDLRSNSSDDDDVITGIDCFGWLDEHEECNCDSVDGCSRRSSETPANDGDLSFLQQSKRPKKVRFADTEHLCRVHPMIKWSFAYRASRKGPWEEYARDTERFNRRIRHANALLEPVLEAQHRRRVYESRFSNADHDVELAGRKSNQK